MKIVWAPLISAMPPTANRRPLRATCSYSVFVITLYIPLIYANSWLFNLSNIRKLLRYNITTRSGTPTLLHFAFIWSSSRGLEVPDSRLSVPVFVIVFPWSFVRPFVRRQHAAPSDRHQAAAGRRRQAARHQRHPPGAPGFGQGNPGERLFPPPHRPEISFNRDKFCFLFLFPVTRRLRDCWRNSTRVICRPETCYGPKWLRVPNWAAKSNKWSNRVSCIERLDIIVKA